MVNDEWCTPKEFVARGGKESLKDWKRAIKIQKTNLRKLIESGELDYYEHKKMCSNQCRSNKGDYINVSGISSRSFDTSCLPSSYSYYDGSNFPNSNNILQRNGNVQNGSGQNSNSIFGATLKPPLRPGLASISNPSSLDIRDGSGHPNPTQGLQVGVISNFNPNPANRRASVVPVVGTPGTTAKNTSYLTFPQLGKNSMTSTLNNGNGQTLYVNELTQKPLDEKHKQRRRSHVPTLSPAQANNLLQNVANMKGLNGQPLNLPQGKQNGTLSSLSSTQNGNVSTLNNFKPQNNNQPNTCNNLNNITQPKPDSASNFIKQITNNNSLGSLNLNGNPAPNSKNPRTLNENQSGTTATLSNMNLSSLTRVSSLPSSVTNNTLPANRLVVIPTSTNTRAVSLTPQNSLDQSKLQVSYTSLAGLPVHQNGHIVGSNSGTSGLSNQSVSV